eukprot:TRINITY_DN1846_c0_g2_i1.p1 TRINITY_DN1846_c0_g2~~TRINITY_DN1846_c0_g2_i1.p1  ORF type:complete len:3716 (+),score=608.79 TRINITY_DN1846_c0_g2_i1:330-11150(+)
MREAAWELSANEIVKLISGTNRKIGACVLDGDTCFINSDTRVCYIHGGGCTGRSKEVELRPLSGGGFSLRFGHGVCCEGYGSSCSFDGFCIVKAHLLSQKVEQDKAYYEGEFKAYLIDNGLKVHDDSCFNFLDLLFFFWVDLLAEAVSNGQLSTLADDIASSIEDILRGSSYNTLTKYFLEEAAKRFGSVQIVSEKSETVALSELTKAPPSIFYRIACNNLFGESSLDRLKALVNDDISNAKSRLEAYKLLLDQSLDSTNSKKKYLNQILPEVIRSYEVELVKKVIIDLYIAMSKIDNEGLTSDALFDAYEWINACFSLLSPFATSFKLDPSLLETWKNLDLRMYEESAYKMLEESSKYTDSLSYKDIASCAQNTLHILVNSDGGLSSDPLRSERLTVIVKDPSLFRQNSYNVGNGEIFDIGLLDCSYSLVPYNNDDEDSPIFDAELVQSETGESIEELLKLGRIKVMTLENNHNKFHYTLTGNSFSSQKNVVLYKSEVKRVASESNDIFIRLFLGSRGISPLLSNLISIPVPICEDSVVLGKLLQFYQDVNQFFMKKDTDINQFINSYNPVLLSQVVYSVSSRLLKSLNIDIIDDIFHHYWSNVLDFNMNIPILSESQEIKNIFISLLSKSEQVAAVITPSQVQQFFALVNRTSHLFALTKLEQSNFDALIENIQTKNRDTIPSFFVLSLVGNFSSQKFAKLMALADNSFSSRLVFVENNLLFELLSGTDNIEHKIIYSNFIQQASRKYIDSYEECSIRVSRHISESEANIVSLCSSMESYLEISREIISVEPRWSDIFKERIQMFYRLSENCPFVLDSPNGDIVIDVIRNMNLPGLNNIEVFDVLMDEKVLPYSEKTVVFVKNCILMEQGQFSVLQKSANEHTLLVFVTPSYNPSLLPAEIVISVQLSNVEIGSADSEQIDEKELRHKVNIFRAISCVFNNPIKYESLRDVHNIQIDPIVDMLESTNDVRREVIEIFLSSLVEMKSENQAEVQPTLVSLLNHISYLGYKLDTEITSFNFLLKNNGIFQLCSQRTRIALWIYTAHRALKHSHTVALTAAQVIFKVPGRNVDSINLLSYFSSDIVDSASYEYQQNSGIISPGEFLLQQSISKGSLDWAMVSESFSEYEKMVDLIITNPEPLKLFLCLPLKAAHKNLQRFTNKTDFKVELFFEVFYNIVSKTEFSGIAEDIARHISLLRWHLFCRYRGREDRFLKLDSVDITNLVNMRLNLNTDIAIWNDIMPDIFSLNEPDNFIVLQIDLREMLYNVYKYKDDNILIKKPDEISEDFVASYNFPLFSRLGKLSLELFLHPLTREACLKSSDNTIMLKHPFVTFINQLVYSRPEFVQDCIDEEDFWKNLALFFPVDENEPVIHSDADFNVIQFNEERRAEFIDQRLAKKYVKLTSIWGSFLTLKWESVLFLLNQLSHKESVFCLCKLLDESISTYPDYDFQRMITNILNNMDRYIYQRMYFLSILAEGKLYVGEDGEEHNFFPNLVRIFSELGDIKPKDDSLRLMLQAFKTRALALYCSENKEIPVDISGILLRVLFDELQDDNLITLESSTVRLQKLNSYKLTESSLGTVMREFSEDESYIITHQYLYLYIWVLYPFVNLSLDRISNEMKTGFLMDIIKDPSLKFKERASKSLSSLSDLALFLCEPALLGFNSLVYYCEQFSKESPKSKNYLICQKYKEDSIYPPYILTLYKINIPRTYLNELKNRIEGTTITESPVELGDFDNEDQRKLTHAFKNIKLEVQSGLSFESLKTNLEAMLTISQLILFVDEDGILYTRYFLLNILYTWFSCVGYKENEIFEMLRADDEMKRRLSLHIPDRPVNNLETSPTLYPFPAYFDVSLKLQSSSKIFGTSTDDVVYTLSCFSSILAPYDKMVTLPLVSLLIEEKDGVYFRRAEYQNFAVHCSELFSEVIREKLHSIEETKVDNSVVYNLQPLLLTIAPLIKLIMDMLRFKDNFYDRTILLILETVISQSEPDTREKQALLHRCLVRTFGITPSGNCSWIHTNILKLFDKFQYYLCFFSSNELKWAARNKYITLGFDLEKYKLIGNGIRSSDKQLKLLSQGWVSGIGFELEVHFNSAAVQKEENMRKSNENTEKGEKKMIFQGENLNISKGEVVHVVNTDNLNFLPQSADELSEYNVYDCSEIVKFFDIFDKKNCMTLKLIPVNSISLVRSKSSRFHFKFTSDVNEEISENWFVRSFVNSENAWDYLTALPVNVVLILDGIIMKHTSEGWAPYIIGDTEYLKESTNRLDVPFFWLLFVYNSLLNFNIPGVILNLIAAMSKVLLESSNPELDVGDMSSNNVRSELIKYTTSLKKRSVINERAFNLQSKIINMLTKDFNIDDSLLVYEDLSSYQELKESLYPFLNKGMRKSCLDVLEGRNDFLIFNSKFLQRSRKIAEITSFEDIDSNTETVSSDLLISNLFGRKIKEQIQYIHETRIENPYLSNNGDRAVGYLISERLFKYTESMKVAVGEWVVQLLRSPLNSVAKNAVLNSLETNLSPEYNFDTKERFILQGLKYSFLDIIPPEGIESNLLSILENIIDFDDGRFEDRISRRRGNKFGIFISSDYSSILQKLSSHEIPLKIVDFKKYEDIYVSDEKMFSITLQSLKKAQYVILDNLPGNLVSDRFFKWCAEYTRKNPWTWIILNNIDVFFLLPENQDRIVDNLSISKGSSSKQTKKFDPVKPLERSSRDTSWEKDFRNITNELIQKKEHMLLVGPPGIGKTYFLDETRKEISAKDNHAVVMFDGSSDILIQISILDFLRNKLGNLSPSCEVLLIADEFHLMTPEQKRQLLQFAFNSPFNIILVMISNRYDMKDLELFRKYNLEDNIVKCRGSFEYLTEIEYVTRSDKYQVGCDTASVMEFLQLFLKVTRGLFGENMLSFRFLKPVIEHLWEDPSDLIQKLADEISKKDLTIEKSFARTLVRQISDLSKKLSEGEKPDIDQIIRSLKQRDLSSLCMLFTSVVYYSDDNEMAMGYPEFSTEAIKNFYNYHPFQRLISWLEYIMERHNRDNPISQYSQNLWVFFSSFSICDLPGRFPLFSTVGGSRDSQCEVYAINGDPDDVQEIIEITQRGFIFNHNSYWIKNSIKDVLLFSELLGLDPNYLSSSVLSTDNILSVLRISEHKLLKTFLEKFCDESNLNRADDPYLTAAWKVYRYYRLSKSHIEDLCLVFQNHYIDLPNLLMWSARFGFDNMEVPSRIDPHQLQDVLYEDLLRVTDYWLETGNHKKICVLWGFQFAPLTDDRLSIPAIDVIASSQYPPLTEWCLLIRDLSHVLNGNIDYHIISRLEENQQFWEYLPHSINQKQILKTILSLDKLTGLTQERLVFSGLSIPDNSDATVRKFEGVVKKYRGEVDKFSLKQNQFYQKLRDFSHALYSVSEYNRVVLDSLSDVAPIPQHIVFAIDVSGSMTSQDVRPNRFKAAMNTIQSCIRDNFQNSPNDLYSLVFHNTTAFTVNGTRYSKRNMMEVSFENEQECEDYVSEFNRISFPSGGNSFNTVLDNLFDIVSNMNTTISNTAIPVVIFLGDGGGSFNNHNAVDRILDIHPHTKFFTVMFGNSSGLETMRSIAQRAQIREAGGCLGKALSAEKLLSTFTESIQLSKNF